MFASRLVAVRLLRAALLVLAPLASGCVGTAAFYGVVGKIDEPQLAWDHPESLQSRRPGQQRMSRAELEHLWGPPDSVETSEGVERWTYVSDSWRWNGVILVLILPIPLLVPVGHPRVTLTLADDQVQSAEVLRTSGGIALYGPFLGPEGIKWSEVHWAEDGPVSSCTVNASWIDRSEPSAP